MKSVIPVWFRCEVCGVIFCGGGSGGVGAATAVAAAAAAATDVEGIIVGLDVGSNSCVTEHVCCDQ